MIRNLVDNNAAQKVPAEFLSPQPGSHDAGSRRNSTQVYAKGQEPASHSSLESSTPNLRESVRATLAPLSPGGSGTASPRASGEWARPSFESGRRSVDISKTLNRASLDRGRRSGSTSRRSQSRVHSGGHTPVVKPQDSTDSFVHSLDHGSSPSHAIHSEEGAWGSASQILNRSAVFNSPTIQRLQQSPSGVMDREKVRRRSQDSARSVQRRASIRIQPPTRSQTQQRQPTSHQRQHEDGNSESGDDHLKSQDAIQHSNSTPKLQELVRAGAYPLQRAAGFAGYLKSRSKRMSNLLATESMGYIGKVSGMWAGGGRHYGDPEGLTPDDHLEDLEDDDEATDHCERFRVHFALPPTEILQATYFGYLHRVLPLYGKVYISDRKFCFRSLLPGTRTKVSRSSQYRQQILSLCRWSFRSRT